jgi:hypothetical protein
MARDNRNHAFYDRDVVFSGNRLVEDRFDARLVFDRGETPLLSEGGEVRTCIQVAGDGPIIDGPIAAFVEPLHKGRQEIEYIVIRAKKKPLRHFRFVFGENNQELAKNGN